MIYLYLPISEALNLNITHSAPLHFPWIKLSLWQNFVELTEPYKTLSFVGTPRRMWTTSNVGSVSNAMTTLQSYRYNAVFSFKLNTIDVGAWIIIYSKNIFYLFDKYFMTSQKKKNYSGDFWEVSVKFSQIRYIILLILTLTLSFPL